MFLNNRKIYKIFIIKKLIFIIVLAGFLSCGDGMDILMEGSTQVEYLPGTDDQIKIATPSISPGGGIYNSDQSVNISCSTGGVTIYYTIDGSDPDESSMLYTGPISVVGHGTNLTIKAIAFRDGMAESDLEIINYSINYDQVSTPVMSVAGGTYNSDQNVNINCATVGATIYYTTDGSDPDGGSAVYSGPISVAGDGTNMTIKAIALKSGMTDSAIATEIYSISYIEPIVDSSGDVGRNSSIAVDGSNIYISFYDYSNGNIKFARSTNGGATWTDIQDIDYVGFSTLYVFTAVAVNGPNVYIAYYDYTSHDLKFARSTDGGVTWPTIQTIESSGMVGRYISIAVDGSNIYLSYYLYTALELRFAMSTDGGDNWPIIQTVDTTNNVGLYTSIAVNGSNVYISYYDNTSNYLKFARSTDGGSTWPTIQTLDSSADVGKYTSIAVNGSNIYISYCDASSNNLKFARSTDSGDTWPTIQTVDSGLIAIGSTSIAIDGSNVYIAYYTGNLKFVRSIDSGDNWQSSQTVDGTGVVGDHNSMAFSGSNIYISYYDDTNDYLKVAKSFDSGVTW